MKTIQKIIIMIYCAFLIGACVYVPWEAGSPVPNSNISISLGYSFFWEPIKISFTSTPPSDILYAFATVDIKRIILSLLAITAFFIILFIIASFVPQKVRHA